MKIFALSGGLLLVCYTQARILQLPLHRLEHDSLSVSLLVPSKSDSSMSKSADFIAQRSPPSKASGGQYGQDYLRSIKDQRIIYQISSQLDAQTAAHQLPVRVSLSTFSQVIVAAQPHHIGLGTSALPHHNSHRHSTPIFHSSTRHRLDRLIHSIFKL